MAKVMKTTFYKVDLYKLCRKANITLSDLARQSNVNYQFLVRVARGTQNITEEKFQSVKKVLDKYSS